MVLTIRGSFIEAPSLGDLKMHHDHLLVIDKDGVIEHFDDATTPVSASLLASRAKQGETVATTPPGSFILPTFFDLHLHAPQFLYQGNGLDLPLLEWLDRYTYTAEERLDSDPALAKRVYDRLARRLVETGTGAVSLFGTIKSQTNHILARSMLDAGIRARIGKLSMDISTRPTYVEASPSESLEAAEAFAADCCLLTREITSRQQPLVEPVLTPRFVPTCSDELLSGLGVLSSRKELHVQSHLAEAHDQVEWVKETRGKDDIEVFDNAGLLTSRTLQAHCTYLTPPDLVRVAQAGTSVAHCPLSNIYFSAKPFPLREALRTGVKVGLGTDVAGGYSADIMSAMRNAVAVSRMREGQRVSTNSDSRDAVENLAITWVESLYLATRGGAIALGGKWKGLGVFRVGTPFDAQQICLIDGDGNGAGALDFFDLDSRREGFTITTDMVEKWWCIGDTRNRKKVWVQGAEILSN